MRQDRPSHPARVAGPLNPTSRRAGLRGCNRMAVAVLAVGNFRRARPASLSSRCRPHRRAYAIRAFLRNLIAIKKGPPEAAYAAYKNLTTSCAVEGLESTRCHSGLVRWQQEDSRYHACTRQTTKPASVARNAVARTVPVDPRVHRAPATVLKACRHMHGHCGLHALATCTGPRSARARRKVSQGEQP